MGEAFAAVMANLIDRFIQFDNEVSVAANPGGVVSRWLVEGETAVAALRAVSAWIGEEEECVEGDEVKAFVPVMVRYCRMR